LIFVSSVLSDFAVKMAWSGNDPWIRVLSGFLAILVMTLLLMSVLAFNPNLRKAISRMFGMEQDS